MTSLSCEDPGIPVQPVVGTAAWIPLDVQYNIVGAAQRLGLSKGTVSRLINEHRLGYLRIGPRCVRITEQQIRDYLASCERQPWTEINRPVRPRGRKRAAA